MTRRHARELREIIADAENVARGLFLAYDKHAMTPHTYAASLAALYMTAFRRVAAVVEEVGP